MYKRRTKEIMRWRRILRTLAVTRRVLLDLVSNPKDNVADHSLEWLFSASGAYSSPGARAEYCRGLKVQEINNAIKSLKRRRFIEARRRGERTIYFLTEKGRMAALRDTARLALEYDDQRLCIVSFDIPNSEGKARDRIRQVLKDLDFEMRQRSVWVSHRQVAPLIARMVTDMDLAPWVEVYEALPVQTHSSATRSARARKQNRRDSKEYKSLIKRKNNLLPGIAGRKRFY